MCVRLLVGDTRNIVVPRYPIGSVLPLGIRALETLQVSPGCLFEIEVFSTSIFTENLNYRGKKKR